MPQNTINNSLWQQLNFGLSCDQVMNLQTAVKLCAHGIDQNDMLNEIRKPEFVSFVGYNITLTTVPHEKWLVLFSLDWRLKKCKKELSSVYSLDKLSIVIPFEFFFMAREHGVWPGLLEKAAFTTTLETERHTIYERLGIKEASSRYFSWCTANELVLLHLSLSSKPN